MTMTKFEKFWLGDDDGSMDFRGHLPLYSLAIVLTVFANYAVRVKGTEYNAFIRVVPVFMMGILLYCLSGAIMRRIIKKFGEKIEVSETRQRRCELSEGKLQPRDVEFIAFLLDTHSECEIQTEMGEDGEPPAIVIAENITRTMWRWKRWEYKENKKRLLIIQKI